MSYTLKIDGKDNPIYIYNELDKRQIHQDARNYLLSQEHRREELQDKLDKKLEIPGYSMADYDCKELWQKIEDVPTSIHLYDIFNRKIRTYYIDRFDTVHAE